MKIKQEASGWPAECNTEEKKRNYLQEYEEHEGIRLDYDKVKKNPSLRLLAKLMLNSFWGKFRPRPNQTQVTTCTKLSEFFQIIKDDRQVIHSTICQFVVICRSLGEQENLSKLKPLTCFHIFFKLPLKRL